MKFLNHLLVLILTMFTLTVLAQTDTKTPYSTALGIKLYPSAISVKHFTKNNTAMEGLGYISSDGFRLTGLYELHYPLGPIDRFQWYVGGGAHLGMWSDSWKRNNPDRAAGIAIGVDGVLGLDYTIKGAPLNVSFDWQPSFNLIGYNYFEGGWGGLAIRYTF